MIQAEEGMKVKRIRIMVLISNLLFLILRISSLVPTILPVDMSKMQDVCLRRVKHLSVSSRPWLSVGAQRIISQQGAYTGGIFVGEARRAGARFALVYHSETKKYYLAEAKEALEKQGALVEEKTLHDAIYKIIKSEIKAILAQGMTPVICVGEEIKIREAGLTLQVVKGQVESILEGLTSDEVSRVVIAYEPIWAIGGSGSGIPATPEVAQEVHTAIRATISGKFGIEVAQRVRILYGGSVNPDNIKGFLAQPDIDGALIGKASADLEGFLKIVEIAQQEALKSGRHYSIMGNWKTYPVIPAVNPFIRGLSVHTRYTPGSKEVEIVIFPQSTEIKDIAELIKELDKD